MSTDENKQAPTLPLDLAYTSGAYVHIGADTQLFAANYSQSDKRRRNWLDLL